MAILLTLEKVDMPEPSLRRFKYGPIGYGRHLEVIDTEDGGKRVRKCSYTEAAVVCHSLNKRHYKSLQTSNSK